MEPSSLGFASNGSPLLVIVTESHEFPGPLLSTRADIFAFGSVLYEIMTRHAPYEGWNEREIRARYLKGEFPETESLQAIGTIIKKCWQGSYNRSEILVHDLRAQETNAFIFPHSFPKTSILLAVVVVATTFLLVKRRLSARVH